MEFISEGSWFLNFRKRSNFEAFFRFSTQRTKNVTKKLRVSYVFVEELFDTIFNMVYGSVKSPMD